MTVFRPRKSAYLMVPLTALIGVSLVAPSAAQEYCVACTAPDAMYRCSLVDAKPTAGQSLQMACLNALTRDGGHGQCSIKRGVTVFECDAPIKRVSMTDPSAQAVVLPPPPAPVPDPNAPPTTVVEAIKRAKEAGDKQSADTATFFKKSLTCLGSLFTRCNN